MPQNLRLNHHILSLRDVIDELKELDEFFQLYSETIEEERQRFLHTFGVEINFERFQLLIKSHQTLNSNLLTRFEDELGFFGRLVDKLVKGE